MKVKTPLIKIGGSRAVILPALWFKQHEEAETMEEVEMEIGETITISPIKELKEGGTNGAEKPSTPDTTPAS
jgi:antitoxin component of MazEF toxin-antitoxin module